MHIAKLAASLLVILALVLGAAPAQAETVNCIPVTAPPYIISVQGVHCFTQDWTFNSSSGNAIEIQTNNVVLDLNGFKLGGLAAGPGTLAYGIYAVSRQNITIKNGTVRGFYNGILLTNGSHLVEDIRADQNRAFGIHVEGSGHIVRNNQVVATGGTTCCGGNVAIYGILGVGSNAQVLNNDVINTVAQGSGTAWGINVGGLGVTGNLVVNNRITRADVGVAYTNSTGKYRDNQTFDVTTPFVPGSAVDAGNNN